MNPITNLVRLFRRSPVPQNIPDASDPLKPGANLPNTTEIGNRTTDDARLRNLYNRMWVDPTLRQAIFDIRDMHRRDPRVKKIHTRTARAITKSGLQFDNPQGNKRLQNIWNAYKRRLSLDDPAKLQSDARGLLMEGNLPMQWVLDADRKNVVFGVRMPAETIRPRVAGNGQFVDPATAYEQWDYLSGAIVATFAQYQMTLGRLDPDNLDDMSSMGRPYLDASRTPWQKLIMTEEDMVIRRRERAPMRTAHILEGATPEQLDAYRADVERDQQLITTNYYLNKKGGVQPVQGDANLDQVADVVHLLDTFFSGAPAPKGLFGYTEGLARDVLEDLKQDFFDELDALQDTISWVYTQGFELQLLLLGMNPDVFDFQISFGERLTETLNQRADRALKLKALGVSNYTALQTAGVDPAREKERIDQQRTSNDPYPDANEIGTPMDEATNTPASESNTAQVGNISIKPRVSVTEGNAKGGESATSISNG